MKHFAGFAASALALAISAQAFAGTVTTDGADIMIKTKGGLEVGTTDKAFSFKLGGRVQADYSRFDGFYTKNGNTADAGYFRRAFLELAALPGAVANLGVGMPAGWLLCFRGGMGIGGMWVGLILGLTCAALLLTLRFHLRTRGRVAVPALAG